MPNRFLPSAKSIDSDDDLYLQTQLDGFSEVTRYGTFSLCRARRPRNGTVCICLVWCFNANFRENDHLSS